MLDSYKELKPILYGEHAVKHLYFEKEAGRMCFQMHWHDRVELLYITAGELVVHLDDSQAEVSAGQVAVFCPRMLHGGFAGENGVTFHAIMFDLDNFYNKTPASEKYLAGLLRNEVYFQTVTANEYITKVVKQLVERLTVKDEENPLLVIGLIYEIVGNLYQFGKESIKPIQKIGENFRNVLEYINTHFTEDISTKSLSQRFGYNETYFCRRFKEVTGITLMKYIQILRMELAQKLLKNTEKGVAEIALECGFTDISYFSNCFKRQVGLAPKEFRKVHG